MKIAILSDTRLPTASEFPGHGLGKMNLAAANGLAERGHAVTLYAGAGSGFELGALVVAEDERKFAPTGFDVILDGTHGHTLQKTLQDAKIVNWSHDREAHPGRCAIYPSAAHAKFWRAKDARIVKHGIDVPEAEIESAGEYAAYMSDFIGHKGPIMAWNAARLAGVPLMMAGRGGMKLPGAEYVGPLFGEKKREFLAKAKCLLFPASIEAAGITLLEAQAYGCPVVVTPYGAAHEYRIPETGALVENTDEMARALGRMGSIDRAGCREFVRLNFSRERMIDGLEAALKDAADRKVW